MIAREEVKPAQHLQVYRAEMFRVSNGANLGDPIGFAEELVLDDLYRLSPLAETRDLALIARADRPFAITGDGDEGRPGHDLHLDCAVTFMSGAGQTTEAIVMVETDPAGNVAQIYLLPLAPLEKRVDYALVGIEPEGALQKFAQLACVSFTAGTLITMASGAQTRVEDLKVGDRVLTRDDGPQEIRWIGHVTQRAVGAFAPIRIRAGMLHNEHDLLVSPDHRLFIYQRTDRLGAGRSELLVRARHLVNGDSVTRAEGGFVDYYQMLFDTHQIIFAEGIAAESMLVDTRTSAALPQEMHKGLSRLMSGHQNTRHAGFDVTETLLARADAADLLRKSTGG